jgi:hypothetical protein
MTAALTPVPKIQFFANDGTPLVGGKLYSYAAGSTTPLATYTTYAGTVANTNPVILDSRGEANVWLGAGPYKLALYDSVKALIWTVDNITPVGDASLVSYLPAGTGAVATTVQTKLRESVSVKDFGAVGDGTTNDTAAIQAAINYVASLRGGVVLFPSGTYRITSTLVIDTANVLLQGAGADIAHDVGALGVLSATQLNWAGSAGGTMMQFVSPVGASAQKQNGGGVVGITFQCASVAGIGIQILSWNSALFENLGFFNPTTTAIDINIVATLGEARDPQANKFSRIWFRCLDGAGVSGSFIRCDGDATANTSFNLFEDFDGTFYNGNAFLLINCDNNLFLRCRAIRAVGGTGTSIEFQGSNSSAAQTARANIFFHWSSNVAPIARGTTSYTYPSTNNNVLLIDADNGSLVPTVETGSTCYFTRTDNIAGLTGAIGFAAGDSAAAVVLAKTGFTNESIRLYNGSGNHAQLTDGTNVWGINIDGSGNFRINRLAGAGTVSFLQNVQTTGLVRANSAAAIPVGGVASVGFTATSTSNLGTFFGSGAPTMSAAQGSLYVRTDGSSTSTRLYVNTNGTTGWTNVVTAT